MELTNQYAYLYAEVPLIVGFNEDISDFAKAFEKVPQKRIASISEFIVMNTVMIQMDWSL